MTHLTLPRTDLSVSSLCLGTGGFGTDIDRDRGFAMLDLFLEQGGDFLDTAHNYGDWVPSAPRSASEHLIGEWFRARGARDRVVLATKGAHWHFDHPEIPRLNRADIVSDLDGSLAALGTDRIDFYWLHRDDPARPAVEILETLNAQKRAGKIRWFGASNWSARRLREAEEAAQANGLEGFAGDQILWNAAVLAGPPYGDPTTGWMDDERFAFHQATGMAVMPYQAQAYGLFNRIAAGTLDQMNPGFRGFYKDAPSRARFAAMQAVMAETGLSVTQVLLGYLTGQPLTTVPILGCRDAAQLRDSLTALDVRLTPDQVRRIRDAAPEPVPTRF